MHIFAGGRVEEAPEARQRTAENEHSTRPPQPGYMNDGIISNVRQQKTYLTLWTQMTEM